MSKRIDIPNRLIYTCRCGWIDIGHATPKSRHPHIGAAELWRQMLEEKGDLEQSGFKGFPVMFKESEAFSRTIGSWETPPVRDGVEHLYIVKRGLPNHDRESVALTIFMQVSYEFEALQAGWLHSAVTDSGFSEEDLVSDLIGFYVAVRPSINWKTLCNPVSTGASLAVWDKSGSVGSHKNRTFKPNSYPCKECQGKRVDFPIEFQSIQAAQPGTLFRKFSLTKAKEALENPGTPL